MRMGFDGRTVLVAGGGSGIGRAAVLAFAAEGCNVAVADVNSTGAKETASLAAAAARAGASSESYTFDITEKAGCDELVRSVVDAFGRLDILVNAVGWTDVTYFVDETPEYWERVLRINLLGAMNLCHAALLPMIEQRSGSIVLCSSDAGKVGANGETAYATAKAGVIALAKSLAHEVSRFNVRVNAVAPGPTETPLLRSQFDQATIDRMTKPCPMKRLARAEEQADAIVYLASDRASFVTGQTLSVSGGLTMSS